MWHDLSVPWPLRPPVAAQPGKKGKGKAVEQEDVVLRIEDRHRLEKTLDMAAELGYKTVAFNLTVPSNCFDPLTIKAYQPCKNGKPPFEAKDPRFGGRQSEKAVLQLSRMTVVYEESCIQGHGNGRCFVASNANHLAEFDLLSVLPLDSAAFTHACLNMSPGTATGIDIITIDLASSPRLPFMLKRTVLLQAVSQGAVFEVVYGIAMRTSGAGVPKDARRNVLAGARELIRVTGGKGIVLSGDVASCMELRAPLDLINLGGLLGFQPDQARAALAENCKKVIMRAYSNRQAYRGTISPPVLLGDSEETKKRKAEDDLRERISNPWNVGRLRDVPQNSEDEE